jgi:hypothetical protein
MLKTKIKLDDLLERYKDLDLVYIINRLEEYDDLVQYYTILRTKQTYGRFQCWIIWMVGDGKNAIQGKND